MDRSRTKRRKTPNHIKHNFHGTVRRWYISRPILLGTRYKHVPRLSDPPNCTLSRGGGSLLQ
jgi:hypothetical protein